MTIFVNIFRGPTFWQFELFDNFEKKNDKKKQLLVGRSMGITVKHDFLVKKKTTTITFRVIPQRGWVRVQQVAFFVFSPCHFWPFYFFFQLCCSKFARARARAHGASLRKWPFFGTYLHLESIDFMDIFDCHIYRIWDPVCRKSSPKMRIRNITIPAAQGDIIILLYYYMIIWLYYYIIVLLYY